MRRRTLIIVLAAATLAGLALVLPFLLKARSGEWTTKSPAALAAFGAGLDSRIRFSSASYMRYSRYWPGCHHYANPNTKGLPAQPALGCVCG